MPQHAHLYKVPLKKLFIERFVSTVCAEEVKKFSRAAHDWWNPSGEFEMLHRMNPLRVGYIRQCITDLHKNKLDNDQLLGNMSILDIGCGGGLLSEVR